MRKFFLLILILVTPNGSEAYESLSYSGRLVRSDGSPITGPVNLLFELSYTNQPNLILCSLTLNNVALTNGVFHSKLLFQASDCSGIEFQNILMATPVNESIALRVTDLSHSKIYSHQAIHSVPTSLMAVMAKTLASMGAATGEVLKWDGMKWAPAPDGGGAGAVTEVNTGTGLTGGPINSTGTISIIDGGVGTTQLSTGAVTDEKIAIGANISRSKLAVGSINSVVINDVSGAMTSLPALTISLGGTGASTAAAARGNLGLGTAAVANIGASSGNLITVDSIPSCPSNQKLQMSLGPTYSFTCVTDLSDSTDKLPLSGGIMNGSIAMGGNQITDLGIPTLDSDTATKKYVDDLINGSSYWSESTGDLTRITGNVGIGITPAQKLHVAGSVRAEASLELTSNNTNLISLQAPDALPNNLTFTLPLGNGTSGQVLTTNGAGLWSWSSVATTSTALSGDVIGTLSSTQIASGVVGSTEISDGSITDIDVASNSITYGKLNLADDIIPLVKINGLTGTLTGKEDAITLGVSTQYFRGDKSWQTLNTTAVAEGSQLYHTPLRVRSTPLDGFVAGANADIAATDTVLGAFGKLQGQINALDTGVVSENGNLYFTPSRSISSVLTGYTVGTSSTLSATDTVLGAFGKVQGQINSLNTANSGKEAAIPAGTTTQYFRGDKTWQSLTTTNITEGSKLFFTNERVGAAVLSGFVAGSALPVAATDTLNQALGKMEGSISTLMARGDWTKNGSNISYDSGNVGIGTGLTPPAAKLEVKGGLLKTEGYIENISSEDIMTHYIIPDTSTNTRHLTLNHHTVATLPEYTSPAGTVYNLTILVKQTDVYTLDWNVASGTTILWDSSTIAPQPAAGWGKYTVYQFMKMADTPIWFASQVWVQH